jgi:uncharacterized protein (DUF433 family)
VRGIGRKIRSGLSQFEQLSFFALHPTFAGFLIHLLPGLDHASNRFGITRGLDIRRVVLYNTSTYRLEASMSDDELIAQFIELDPRRPAAAEARLIGSNVPVWALIGYLQTPGADTERVATDYDVPVAAVEAAQAYYQRNHGAIDARIATNNAEFHEVVEIVR